MAEITATHNIASSSTASASVLESTPYVHYDIFVHHYEDETREFAMKLCKCLVARGLVVFLDGSEKEVTSGMEAAISLAFLQIAIFSPNYATCKWCMDTLVQMTKSEAPVLPVFYRAEPSHLRHKDKGCEGTYDSQTMQAWRNALRNVSNISGFNLKKHNGGEEEHLCRDEEELSCKILERVESVMKTWSRCSYHVFICHRGEMKEEFAEPLYRRLHGLWGYESFWTSQKWWWQIGLNLK